jgi:nitroreductase
MHPVAPETVLAQLNWRYATKKFDSSKKIPPDVWAKLEQAVVLSPSSYGLQPWHFVVVTDPDVRKKLQAVGYNQSQIVDASHLVVFCAKKPPTPADVDRFIARTAEVRGTTPQALDGYKQMILGGMKGMSADEAHTWAAKQCYTALGVFLSAAAMFGVDACPMEGFQPDGFDEVLGLKAKGVGSVVLATAGYRAADDNTAAYVKSRFKVDDVVTRV